MSDAWAEAGKHTFLKRLFARILASLLMVMLLAEPAIAASLDCSATIDSTNNMVSTTTPLSAVNTAPGPNGQCSSAPGIFNAVACLFTQEAGIVMSSVYCHFQTEMKGPLSAALVLFISLYGIALMTGIVTNPTKESAIVLFKLALIWGFATTSYFGIGFAYTLFMDGTTTIINIIVNAIGGLAGTPPTLGTPDALISGTLQAMGGVPPAANTGTNPFPTTFTSYCQDAIAVALVVTSFLLPVVPVTIIGLGLQYVGIYARTLLAYLVVLTLTSFLFVFSPIFLGCALFKSTYSLFENWLKYLTVLAVELILTFAFFALINFIIAPVAQFSTQVLSLVREYDTTWQFSGNKAAMPMHICSFCEYNIRDIPSTPSVPISGSLTTVISLPSTISCTNTPYTTGGVTSAPAPTTPTTPTTPPPPTAQSCVAGATKGMEPTSDTRVYTNPDGSTYTKQGGTRAWRNNNPGNIKYGPFAVANGAIGEDSGGFAIFPNEQTGLSALNALVTQDYSTDSIATMMDHYAPPSENDTTGYIASLVANIGGGVTANTVVSSLSSSQFALLVNGIESREGQTAGTITNGSAQTTGTSTGCTGTAVSPDTSSSIATGQTSSSASTIFVESVDDANPNETPTLANGVGQNVWPLWSLLNSYSVSMGDSSPSPAPANPPVHLLSFLMENFIALWLILSVLIELFKRAEEIAKSIGGMPFAIGITGDGLPGMTSKDDSLQYPVFNTANTIAKSFENLISTRPWNPKP